MTTMPLTFGPLDLAGCRVMRSEVRWLCGDGHRCQAGEVAATCSLAISGGDPAVLADERSSIRVDFAVRSAGRIFHMPARSRGGILGWLPAAPWNADDAWARFEHDGDVPQAPFPLLSFRAMRPMTDLASGAASDGWRDRARAWSAAWEDSLGSTVLGIGICEQDAILRGYAQPFAAVLAGAPGPIHVVHGQDEPLVPSARVLIEAAARTPSERIAIREDVARTLSGQSPPLSPGAWIFAGALMNALERSPLDEDYHLITRRGLLPVGKADAVCVSLHAELPRRARHKRLGYTVNAHDFRVARAGPAIQHWLRSEFEPVAHGPDDIARDLRALVTALGGRPLLIINTVSSQAYEHVRSYAGFDDATMRSLGTVRAKTLNLLLHDLARDLGIIIVDADAIVAEMGMAAHLPDGVHGSDAYYCEVRAELLYQLKALGLPGFS